MNATILFLAGTGYGLCLGHAGRRDWPRTAALLWAAVLGLGVAWWA